MKNKGFTLIEVLITMIIIGLLSVMGISNYMNSFKSGRDARRKSDLKTIQTALENYYQDNNSYPVGSIPDPFCHPDGCDIAQYLQTLPRENSSVEYAYDSADGTYYKIYSCIENTGDNGPGVDQNGYVPDCSGGR